MARQLRQQISSPLTLTRFRVCVAVFRAAEQATVGVCKVALEDRGATGKGVLAATDP